MAGVRKINLRNNSIPSSPTSTILMKQVVVDHEDDAPGIVTILRSEAQFSGTKAAASIRKTLSADMSSKKWLEHNGFIKKIPSSSEVLVLPDHYSSSSSSFSSSSEDDDEEEEEAPGQDDVWRSIQQAEKEKKKKNKEDVWGSMTNNTTTDGALPPPYVHPLVKRSASTLSEKSLEICTESLGSETGSDCFSSEIDDENTSTKNRGKELQLPIKDEVNNNLPKYKQSPVRPFPPPLASIGDGAALHMHSHRQDGRLVVEAVSVPPKNYFHSQRGEGRLVLTLIHPPTEETMVDEEEENRVEEEKVFDDIEDVPVEDDSGGADAEEEEQQLSVSLPSTGMMTSVTKTGFVVKKLMNMNINMNPKWTNNKTEDVVEEAEQVFPIPQSLPMVARLIAPPPSFNAYDYFWRKTKHHHHQDYVAEEQDTKKKKKTEYSVIPPYMRGCKEARMRSLLIWDPYCIATS